MNYLKKVQLTADDLPKALHWHFICVEKNGKEVLNDIQP